MIEIALASINTFVPNATQGPFVPPSDQLITLTSDQLQDLIKEAIQPLQDRIGSLEARITTQDENIASLESTQAHTEENQLIQLRLIHDLRESRKGPGKTEMSRADKIEKYLASRPDHKATFETLKGHLGADKFALNMAIKTLMDSSPGRYGITPTPGDKRKRTLIMLLK